MPAPRAMGRGDLTIHRDALAGEGGAIPLRKIGSENETRIR